MEGGRNLMRGEAAGRTLTGGSFVPGLTGLYDPFCDRVAREPRDVVDVQKVHDFQAMRFDSLDADKEPFCYLFVRISLGNELENLGFAVGESGLFAPGLAPRDNLPIVGDHRGSDRRR